MPTITVIYRYNIYFSYFVYNILLLWESLKKYTDQAMVHDMW
jgi:hypothetical protein